MKNKSLINNLIYLLPALGLFIYLFHPLFWSSVIDNDMTTYFYYFYKKLFFSELHNGELPLWNPGVALGYYQVGNPLHGYFYPLNLIFFLLPFDLAYNWLIVIHYFLAGLFMYLLVKTLTGNLPALKISPPSSPSPLQGEGNIAAALFAAVTYAFSGVMISLSKNIGFLFGAVWYPLILFSLEKYLGHPGQTENTAKFTKCHPERQRRIWFFRRLIRNRDSSPSTFAKASVDKPAQNDSQRVQQGSKKYLGLLTLAFCCQFLTGDLQSFAIGVGLAVIQLVIRSHQLEPIHKAPARFALSLGRAGLFLIGSLALALGISMIQLLPLLDMAGQSYRLQGIPLEEAGYFSLNPQRLFNLFHPFLWGQNNLNTFWGEKLANSLTMKQFWYPSVYLGIAPIFLALCSLLSLRNNRDSSSRQPGLRMTSEEDFSGLKNRGLAIWYFILIVVFFLLACGSFTPVWPWIFTHLPGFSLFRFPAKYFSLVNFFLAILAGLGLANILAPPNPNKQKLIDEAVAKSPKCHPEPASGGRRIWFLFFPVRNRDSSPSTFAKASVDKPAQNDKENSLPRSFYIIPFLVTVGFAIVLISKYPAFQAEISSHLQINTGRALSDLRQGYFFLALFSTASALLIFLLARAKGGKNYLIFALFLLLGIDLFLGLNPLKVTNRRDFHRAPEIYSQVLSREEPHSYRLWFDPGSVPFFKTNSYREVLVPNSALDDRVDYFFGNEPALPSRTCELYRFDNLGNLAEFINLADTKYVLTNIQQSGRPIAEIYPRLSGLKAVFTDPEKNILLFRNENARPRFHVVNQWEWVPSGREVFQKMFSPGANPGVPALLEGNECLKSGKIQKMGACRDRILFPTTLQIPPFPPLSKGGDGGLKIIQYSPNRVDLEAGLPAPGLLIFNDSYYPGWRAQVDGQDKEIYRSNYLFKGIFLSGGEHRVSFIFRPASYAWGKGITIFCLGGILLTAILAGIKGRRRKTNP